MTKLQITGAFTDISCARQLASDIGGQLFCDERENTAHLPFAALVCGVTDDLRVFKQQADIGYWLVCSRVIKPRQRSEFTSELLPGAIGLFTMIKRSGLSHEESDSYWRDNHAPLALEVHKAMSHYRQLSILQCFSGPKWDGFALCGFDSLNDLREKFYSSPDGERAIAKDVARFADSKNSPRRIIATEYSYNKR